MPPIRSTAEIAQKFITVTPGRAQEYQRGVTNPNKDWATETADAEDRYEKGVTNAIGQKRFGKGVQAAGTDKWKRGAVEKGVSRWPEGVQGSADAYAKGFGPFRDVIKNLTLPPRGPVGSPANLARVAAVANALHSAKIAG